MRGCLWCAGFSESFQKVNHLERIQWVWSRRNNHFSHPHTHATAIGSPFKKKGLACHFIPLSLKWLVVVSAAVKRSKKRLISSSFLPEKDIMIFSGGLLAFLVPSVWACRCWEKVWGPILRAPRSCTHLKTTFAPLLKSNPKSKKTNGFTFICVRVVLSDANTRQPLLSPAASAALVWRADASLLSRRANPPQQRTLLSERREAESRAADTSADTSSPFRRQASLEEQNTHERPTCTWMEVGSWRWGEESRQPESTSGGEKTEVDFLPFYWVSFFFFFLLWFIFFVCLLCNLKRLNSGRINKRCSGNYSLSDQCTFFFQSGKRHITRIFFSYNCSNTDARERHPKELSSLWISQWDVK